jgi:hypothetical protein
MKKTCLIFILLTTISSTTLAQIFVETIANVSARDAVTIEGDQLYASNFDTGEVFLVELDGTFSNIMQTSNRGPAGIRIGDNGDIFIALFNENSIIRIDAQGNETLFASNIREPIALDFDSDSNLYVNHFNGGTTVTRISLDGTQTPLPSVTALNSISSVALDDNNDVYVTSYFSGDIYRITPSGDISLFATSDASGYSFLQFDSTNNVFYAAIFNTNTLMRFDALGNPEVIINSPQGGDRDGPLDIASINSAIGLAISDNGNQVYFATNTQIRRLNIADPNVDQVRPFFTSDEAADAEENSDFMHFFEFEDPNGEPLTLMLGDLPDFLVFDGVSELSGTPTANDAGQVFNINASLTDGIDTVSQTLSITVAAAAAPTPPPAPTPAPSSSSGGGSLSYLAYVFLLIISIRKFVISRPAN